MHINFLQKRNIHKIKSTVGEKRSCNADGEVFGLITELFAVPSEPKCGINKYQELHETVAENS